MSTIAKRVRDCRYAKGWGPDELASRASISRTALYQIECGKTETPRAGTLRRIAEALGVSIETLLGADEGRTFGFPASSGRFEEASAWEGPDEDQPARRLPKNRTGRYFAPREPDILRKFQDVLDSPLGEGVARIVEEAYRLLPVQAPKHEG